LNLSCDVSPHEGWKKQGSGSIPKQEIGIETTSPKEGQWRILPLYSIAFEIDPENFGISAPRILPSLN